MRKPFITNEQHAWLQKYEDVTTFEPLYLDELRDGTLSFAEVARRNIQWFRDWATDVQNDISHHVPDDHAFTEAVMYLVAEAYT